MDLVTINFWDSFSSVRTNQQTDPNKDTSSPASAPTTPDHHAATAGAGTATPTAGETTPPVQVEPSRDEVTDPSRGDQEGESRDEEKSDNHQVATTECQHSTTRDVSVFSTLTELFFNPFLDGYCQTPFCSDADYLPPSCPSGRFYTAPQQQVSKFPIGHHPANKHSHSIHTPNHHPIKTAVQPQNYHHKHHGGGGGGGGVADEVGDISRSNSGTSSGHSSSAAVAVRKRHRQRPLAFAVGHGDEWKDLEGRRVVITRSGGSGTTSPKRRSPYRYRQQQQQHPQSPPVMTRCTCNPAESDNNPNNPNLSPHQTKSVLCKACQQMQDLEVPPSHSSGTLSSHSHTPLL